MEINKVRVYGLDESVIASGLPMTAFYDNPDFDMARAIKLGNTPTGSGHSAYLKGIIVQFDMKLSQAMLAQIERYHFIDIVSSQSKMHRIETVSTWDFNNYVEEDVVRRFINLKGYLQEAVSEGLISRNDMLKRLVYNCPCGLEMTARFTTNYLQLKTIYEQRKNHRLDEWQEFCEWVATLPSFNKLCLGGE